MLFTRHFYRADEVKAALQMCILKRRSEEALFWSLELLESEEFRVLKDALFNTWFHCIGLANIHILTNILELVEDENTVFTLVYSLCYTKRDCTLSVMYLYGLTNTTYKNRNIIFNLPEDLVQSDAHMDTYIRACALGKYLDAWMLSIVLWKKNIHEFNKKLLHYKYNNNVICTIYTQLQDANFINRWYLRCSIVGILCFAEKHYTEPINYLKSYTSCLGEIQLWKSLITKRKRRIYAIPKDCLYGRTYRGTMTYNENNDEELHEPPYILQNQIIYHSIIEQYGSYESFYNEDNYDMFMDWYFPDDIPDEWSLEDRKKSHGIGINQKGDTPSLRKYFNRWVDLKSDCKIWNKELIVNKCLQDIHDYFNTYYIEDELFEKYDLKNEEIKIVKNAWNLNSLKLVLSALE
jgi:hypothetical protein